MDSSCPPCSLAFLFVVQAVPVTLTLGLDAVHAPPSLTPTASVGLALPFRLPVPVLLRFDAMCASADAIGTKAGEPPAPEAGLWFEYQIEQLAANARLGPKPEPPPARARPAESTSRVHHPPSALPPYAECELARGTHCPQGYECVDPRRSAAADERIHDEASRRPLWCMPTPLRLEEARHDAAFSTAYEHALGRINVLAAPVS